MNKFATTDQIFLTLLKDALNKKESLILAQLNNLIRNGILTVQETSPILTLETNSFDPTKDELKLEQAVRLTFNAEIVLEEYRKKVETLTKKIEDIQRILSDDQKS